MTAEELKQKADAVAAALGVAAPFLSSLPVVAGPMAAAALFTPKVSGFVLSAYKALTDARPLYISEKEWLAMLENAALTTSAETLYQEAKLRAEQV